MRTHLQGESAEEYEEALSATLDWFAGHARERDLVIDWSSLEIATEEDAYESQNFADSHTVIHTIKYIVCHVDMKSRVTK